MLDCCVVVFVTFAFFAKISFFFLSSFFLSFSFGVHGIARGCTEEVIGEWSSD